MPSLPHSENNPNTSSSYVPSKMENDPQRSQASVSLNPQPVLCRAILPLRDRKSQCMFSSPALLLSRVHYMEPLGPKRPLIKVWREGSNKKPRNVLTDFLHQSEVKEKQVVMNTRFHRSLGKRESSAGFPQNPKFGEILSFTPPLEQTSLVSQHVGQGVFFFF